MNRRALLLGIAALLPLAACNSAPKAASSAGMLNAKCPMKPDSPLPEAAPTVDYKGGKVGFCCKGCINKWNAATEDQRAMLLDKVK